MTTDKTAQETVTQTPSSPEPSPEILVQNLREASYAIINHVLEEKLAATRHATDSVFSGGKESDAQSEAVKLNQKVFGHIRNNALGTNKGTGSVEITESDLEVVLTGIATNSPLSINDLDSYIHAGGQLKISSVEGAIGQPNCYVTFENDHLEVEKEVEFWEGISELQKESFIQYELSKAPHDKREKLDSYLRELLFIRNEDDRGMNVAEASCSVWLRGRSKLPSHQELQNSAEADPIMNDSAYTWKETDLVEAMKIGSARCGSRYEGDARDRERFAHSRFDNLAGRGVALRVRVS